MLALFSTIKDNTAGKTVYGELNSLLQNVTDRMYIAPELSGGSARPGELTKADIYSLGRLIAFVYTGEPRADLDDLRIPCAMVELVQKLTDPDPRGGRTSTRCGRDWKAAASALSTVRRPARHPPPAGGCAVG